VQPGGDARAPVNGSALSYFGPDPKLFEAEFGTLGRVIESRRHKVRHPVG
jgi:hypothetical protein